MGCFANSIPARTPPPLSHTYVPYVVEKTVPCDKTHVDDFSEHRGVVLTKSTRGKWKFELHGKKYNGFDDLWAATTRIDGILNKNASPLLAYKALRYHPNFKLPELSDDATAEEICDFVVEACATFVSPKKLPGESEEFECHHVAAAIRRKLGPELAERVGAVLRAQEEARRQQLDLLQTPAVRRIKDIPEE